MAMFDGSSNTLSDSDSFSWLFDATNSLPSALFLISAALFLYALIGKPKRWQPPLPPGPRGLPLVGNLLSLDPELHTYFAGLAETHGPILSLRLGGKLGVVVTSPAMALEVMREHDTTFANRDVPVAAREVSYGGSDIAWSPYGPEWRMLRKVCVREMLSAATLDSVYELRRRETRETIKYLRSRVGSPVNVGEQIFLTTMNVITGMMWGGSVGGKEERNVLGAEFRQLVADITALLGTPNLSDFYPGLARFDLQGVRRKMRVLAKRFDEMFEKMIEKRLRMDGGNSEDKGSKDFLQFLLQLKDSGGDAKLPFTMIHLKALLMDMVVGGTDTTSNTMEFAMAEMMGKPEIMRRAQKEIDCVVGRDNTVEESHIYELPYLHAVMKETLRLHPTLPLLVPHCPSQTTVVGGYTVPKGSRVFVNVWAIQRDPSVWDSPSEFRPERFLDGNKRWDYGGNDFGYFPFGSGRRICPGTVMAERLFLYSVASFLHSFDWELPAGEVDLSEKFGIVLKMMTPLVAIPTPRLADAQLYE